jgi:hypothetical protein
MYKKNHPRQSMDSYRVFHSMTTTTTSQKKNERKKERKTWRHNQPIILWKQNTACRRANVWRSWRPPISTDYGWFRGGFALRTGIYDTRKNAIQRAQSPEGNFTTSAANVPLQQAYNSINIRRTGLHTQK